MIEQIDRLDFLRQQPADSIDLIFFSPPYEDCRTYGIDFAHQGQAWVDFMVETWKECDRVCKGVVAAVVEGKTKNFRWSATPALLMADLHRAGLKLRKPAAFHRVGIPGSGGPDWLRNDYEFIVCTSKGKLPWSDNTAMGKPPKWSPGGAMSYRNAAGERKNGVPKLEASNGDLTPRSVEDGRQEQQQYVPPEKSNPGNKMEQVYQFTASQLAEMMGEANDWQNHIVGGGVMGNPLCHENEAPFPESLAEFFIRSFCPPDGLVCDPFMGSGTTLAVALQCNRRAIGCDIRESQVELTKRRLETVQRELFV